jgi:hypothetical protein
MGEIKPACRFGRVERQDFDFPHNLSSVHENLTYSPVGGMVDKRTQWVARRLHQREGQVDEHQIGLLACGDATEIVAHQRIGASASSSFDHFVGAAGQRRRDGEPERFGSFEVYHQLHLDDLLDRQIGMLAA